MRTIPRSLFEGTAEQLQSRVAAFRQAREDHRLTEGVPAPRDHELIEWLAASDEEFELEPEPTAPEPPEIPLQTRLEIAVRIHLDEAARALGYDGMFSAVTYAEEPAVPRFQSEGRALRAWRSLVWAKCYEILAEVEAGTRQPPSEAELIAALPETPG